MFVLKKYVFLLIVLFTLFSGGCKAVGYNDLPEITSGYGWRVHPIDGEYKFHTGVDFQMNVGTPIYALMNGYIISSGDYGDGYGNQVLIYNNETNTYIRFAHLSLVNVSVGQYVNRGELIALSGATGNVTGPHLHFEYMVFKDGRYVYENPLVLYNLG